MAHGVYYCPQSQNSVNHILGTNYQKTISVLSYCILKGSCLPLPFIKINFRPFICILLSGF